MPHKVQSVRETNNRSSSPEAESHINFPGVQKEKMMGLVGTCCDEACYSQGSFTLQRVFVVVVEPKTTLYFIYTCLMWILVVVVDGGVGLLDCNLSLSQVLDSGGDYDDFFLNF